MTWAVPIDGVLFDMDGVLTDTAEAHAAAWKRVFDVYLERRARARGDRAQPFDLVADYRQYVDGKLRQDGVASFLGSRGIELPYGSDDDGPEMETVCGLARRKDGDFRAWLGRHAVRPFADALDLVDRLKKAGVGVAVFSASRNLDAVLRSSGIGDLFEVRVGGVEAASLDLPGKPDPAILYETAGRLGVNPPHAAVFEDAVAGVEAGVRGGFGLVVGVARRDAGEALSRVGAHLVVDHLAEIQRTRDGSLSRKTPATLPRVLDHEVEIRQRLVGKVPVLVLASGRTLTPLLAGPGQQPSGDRLHDVVGGLVESWPVVVMGPGDADELKRRVGLDAVWYVGDEGPVMVGPGGRRERLENAGRDRGRVLRQILGRLGLDRPGIVPVFVGGDQADEQACRALVGRGLSVVVDDDRRRPTAADYGAETAVEVTQALERWLAARNGRVAGQGAVSPS